MKNKSLAIYSKPAALAAKKEASCSEQPAPARVNMHSTVTKGTHPAPWSR